MYYLFYYAFSYLCVLLLKLLLSLNIYLFLSRVSLNNFFLLNLIPLSIFRLINFILFKFQKLLFISFCIRSFMYSLFLLRLKLFLAFKNHSSIWSNSPFYFLHHIYIYIYTSVTFFPSILASFILSRLNFALISVSREGLYTKFTFSISKDESAALERRFLWLRYCNYYLHVSREWQRHARPDATDVRTHARVSFANSGSRQNKQISALNRARAMALTRCALCARRRASLSYGNCYTPVTVLRVSRPGDTSISRSLTRRSRVETSSVTNQHSFHMRARGGYAPVNYTPVTQRHSTPVKRRSSAARLCGTKINFRRARFENGSLSYPWNNARCVERDDRVNVRVVASLCVCISTLGPSI